MRNTPMMANPTEYREALWEGLYSGVAVRSSGDGLTVKKADLDAMEAMLAQAEALRAQQPDLDS